MCAQNSIHDCVTNFIIYGLVIGTADEELVLRAEDKADGGSAWGPGWEGKVTGIWTKRAWAMAAFRLSFFFFCVKIVQGYGEIFCRGLSCNRFMKTWKEHNPNFNDFDRIWSLGCWDNGTVMSSVSLLPLCRWSAGCSRWCGYKPWGLSSHRSQLTNDQQSAKPEGKNKIHLCNVN